MDRTIIELKIPNYNNKLASFHFVHLFKSLGKYHIWHFQEQIKIKIEGVEGYWIIYDIGHSMASEIPNWLCYQSHGYGSNKQIIQKIMKVNPDDTIYWFLFVREDIYNETKLS